MNKSEVKIVYCPTEKMIADYSSKPTQGSLFIYQRNTILSIKEEDFDTYKQWYKDTIECYGIWNDEESDLATL